MKTLQLALPVLVLSVYFVNASAQQPSMAETKSWLESEGQKSMRVTAVKTRDMAGLARADEKVQSVSDLKLDACALSWTEQADSKTTIGGKVLSEIRFRSTNTVPLEDIQLSFSRVDVDRAFGDAPVYVVYMQTGRPTVSVLSGEVAGEGQAKGKPAPPKRYTERSAKILVNTLDEAQRITDAVLRAAALCGAR
jgi:hypothetical protein